MDTRPRLFSVVFFLFALSSSSIGAERCQELQKSPPLAILSIVETVELIAVNQVIEALVDTGAQTTSLDARNIDIVRLNSVAYVDYELVDRRSGRVTRHRDKVVRMVRIIRHDGSRLVLPVIKMSLRAGRIDRYVDVSLMDRRAFPYAMLLGRNFIGNDILVGNRPIVVAAGGS